MSRPPLCKRCSAANRSPCEIKADGTYYTLCRPHRKRHNEINAKYKRELSNARVEKSQNNESDISLTAQANLEPEQHEKSQKQCSTGYCYLILSVPIHEPRLDPKTGEEVWLVKIGSTLHIDKRRSRLQTGSPEVLYLLAFSRGGRLLERKLQIQYAKYRVHYPIKGGPQEWFSFPPSVVLQLVSRMARGDFVENEKTSEDEFMKGADAEIVDVIDMREV